MTVLRSPRLTYGQTVDLPGCTLTVTGCDRWPNDLAEGRSYPVCPGGMAAGTVAGVDQHGQTRFWRWTGQDGWSEVWTSHDGREEAA